MSKITDKELNNFWSFVESVCWDDSDDSYTQKRSIMKRFSSLQTGKFLPTCKDLSRKLVEKYNKQGIKLSYFAAANIVGKGKDIYNEYYKYIFWKKSKYRIVKKIFRKSVRIKYN